MPSNSKVTLRPLDRDAIGRIIARSDPTRLAGGYSVRRKNDPLVARIDGSYSNVVGLPMETVVPILRRLR